MGGRGKYSKQVTGGTNVFGTNILLARRENGWTQRQLADEAGTTQQTVSDLETGKVTNIGIDQAFALCDALGVSLIWAYGKSPYQLAGLEDGEDTAAHQNTLLEDELLGMFRQLTPQDQERVLGVAALFLDASKQKHAQQLNYYLSEIEAIYGPPGVEEFLESLRAAATGDLADAVARVKALRATQQAKQALN